MTDARDEIPEVRGCAQLRVVSRLGSFVVHRGLRAGAVLKPESWAQVYTPVVLTDGKSHPYGFGWRLDEVQGQKVHRHGGSWQGFKSDVARYLGSDLTVIVFANLAQAKSERVTDAVAALVEPALATKAE